MPESNPGATDSEPSREELDVELPVDWGELKAEVLRRDGGECAICGTGADDRQLYVLYSRPPSYPSRVQPSPSTHSPPHRNRSERGLARAREASHTSYPQKWGGGSLKEKIHLKHLHRRSYLAYDTLAIVGSGGQLKKSLT
jgi:hypothetical protein